jgi:hypothetical protein
VTCAENRWQSYNVTVQLLLGTDVLWKNVFRHRGPACRKRHLLSTESRRVYTCPLSLIATRPSTSPPSPIPRLRWIAFSQRSPTSYPRRSVMSPDSVRNRSSHHFSSPLIPSPSFRLRTVACQRHTKEGAWGVTGGCSRAINCGQTWLQSSIHRLVVSPSWPVGGPAAPFPPISRQISAASSISSMFHAN